MHRCCNCKKEALILPYVCSDCFDKITKKGAKNYESIINAAIDVLKVYGHTEEAKTIEIMMREDGQ